MKDVGFWVTALIGLPFFILAYAISSIWLGLEIGWKSVAEVVKRS